MYKVGQRVTIAGQDGVWVITAVHRGAAGYTYDLMLETDTGKTLHNVPEGAIPIGA